MTTPSAGYVPVLQLGQADGTDAGYVTIAGLVDFNGWSEERKEIPSSAQGDAYETSFSGRKNGSCPIKLLWDETVTEHTRIRGYVRSGASVYIKQFRDGNTGGSNSDKVSVKFFSGKFSPNPDGGLFYETTAKFQNAPA